MDNGTLADRILAAWQALDIKQRIEDFPCGAPDCDDLAAILDIAFFASIQREEGRFVTFSLMFLQTHKPTHARHRLAAANRFMAFDATIDLSVGALCKLAGAVDERTATLVVEKRGSPLVISGIAPFGRPVSRLSPAAMPYPRPEALSISARAPGSLLVSRGNANLGRFADGTFEPAQVTPFYSQALGGDLIAHIARHEAYATWQVPYWHWYRDALDHLLRAASARGHGGLIVWVPRLQAEAALAQTRLGYRLAGFASVYESFIELVGQAEIARRRVRELLAGTDPVAAGAAGQALVLATHVPDLKVRASTLIESVAQLASTDGAAIIDDRFEPLTFGTRLSAPVWTGPVRTGPHHAGDGGTAVARDRFGTRHNSAIDYVAAVPGAIAFVLSQDGPVRAITRRDDTVLVWPDCLSTMSVD